MSDCVVVLVARGAGERLGEIPKTIGRLLERLAEDGFPKIELRYRSSVGTVAIVVSWSGTSIDAETIAREFYTCGGDQLEFSTIVSDPQNVDTLVAGFDVVIDDLSDPVAAVARLQEATKSSAGARRERRSVQRFAATKIIGSVDIDHTRYTGQLGNLSIAGCFIETGDPVPDIGTQADVRLIQEDNHAALRALVVFQLPLESATRQDRLPGFGLKFLALEPGSRAALERMIASAADEAGLRGRQRRTEQRVDISTTISISTPDEVRQAFTENMSTGGMFVIMDDPPPKGSMVEVQLDMVGSGQPLVVTASVLHSVRPDEAESTKKKPGVGLRFERLALEDAERLAQYLKAVQVRSRQRILIADDTVFFRTILRDLLRSAGYQVLEASTGEEALTLIADEVLGLDLVILDVNMPGMSGVEVVDRIRRIGGEAEFPVLILSGAVDDPEERQIIRDIGANEFATKDTSLPEVLRIVDDLVRGRNRQATR